MKNKNEMCEEGTPWIEIDNKKPLLTNIDRLYEKLKHCTKHYFVHRKKFCFFKSKML